MGEIKRFGRKEKRRRRRRRTVKERREEEEEEGKSSCCRHARPFLLLLLLLDRSRSQGEAAAAASEGIGPTDRDRLGDLFNSAGRVPQALRSQHPLNDAVTGSFIDTDITGEAREGGRERR